VFFCASRTPSRYNAQCFIKLYYSILKLYVKQYKVTLITIHKNIHVITRRNGRKVGGRETLQSMAKSVVAVIFLRIQHLDVGASDTFPFLCSSKMPSRCMGSEFKFKNN